MGGVIIWASIIILVLSSHFIFPWISQIAGINFIARLDFFSRSQVWLPLFALGAAGAVDHDVDLAKGLAGLGDQTLQFLLARQTGGDRQGGAGVFGIDFSRHRVARVLIAAGDEDLVKIHFHTNEPWKILEYCNTVGEIYDIVVEDMIRQAAGQQG